jgi:competence protein ComEC
LITTKDITLLAIILLFLGSINITFSYFEYQSLVDSKVKTAKCLVKNQYRKFNKNSKEYSVLKLECESFTFFTTTWEELKDIKNRYVKLKFFTDKVTFWSYLKGFYAVSFNISLQKERSNSYLIGKYINELHTNSTIKEFYSAIFLGFGISSELREVVSKLAISHLIAISGLHLSIFTLMLFWILSKAYKPIQNRFFPYRNSFEDVTLIIFTILVLYLTLLGFIPSLARAFTLWLIGSYLFFRGVEILSLNTLLITVMLLVAIYPNILFNIGFLLSVSGVFYIFLYLKHFKFKKIDFILIHILMFFLMTPFSLYLFNTYSHSQLLSIPLSLAFNILYPFEIVAHIFGFGDILDSILIELFSLNFESKEVILSPYFMAFYITLSLFAIKFKTLFFLLISISISLFFYYW